MSENMQHKKVDYPELIGYKFYFVPANGGEPVECMVVDANFWIGITAVEANNTSIERLCLNKKQYLRYNDTSELTEELNEKEAFRLYHNIFFHDIEAIKSGEYHQGRGQNDTLAAYPTILAKLGGRATCAFR